MGGREIPFDDLEDLDYYETPQGEKETQLDKITGVAEYINTRATSFGTMYSLKVNGTNYSLGKTDPTAKFQIVKGDAVEFTAEQNAKGYWDIKGPVKKLTGAVGVERPAAAAAVAASNSYRAADDNKQKTISRQAARNTAVQFMTLLHNAGALPVAKAGGKGGNFDLLRETLDKLTDEFYNDSLDPKSAAAAPSGAIAAAESDGEWTE